MGDYVKSIASRQRSDSESRSSLVQDQGNRSDALLNSRTCCKVLVIWSLMSTLVFIVSAYYALDIRNSVLLNRELRDLNEIMVSAGGQELVGKHFRRARVLHRHGFYYNLARANKRSKNKGLRSRRFNTTSGHEVSDVKHRLDSTQDGGDASAEQGVKFTPKFPKSTDRPLTLSDLDSSIGKIDLTENAKKENVGVYKLNPEGNMIWNERKRSNKRKKVKKVLKDLIEILAEGSSSGDDENISSVKLH